jgi:actin related protein 2/3 complex subunit 1A/1B
LDEHGGYISGIDWCAATNQIVTCGHDRNAYVWSIKDGKWHPALVILRINRAATAVKWSPDGKKFAVASGTKCVPICTYDKEHDWWVCTMIKKHKSTVVAVDWSPNGKFVITGACDFKARIFSAFVAGIDNEANDDYSFWAKANEFGECLAEFDQAKAWVTSVSWAPNGKQVAFVGHGSTVHFVNIDGGANDCFTYNSKALPYNHINFLCDNTAVCCGFDLNPTLFTKSGSSWELTKKIDEEKKGTAAKATGGAAAARAMFQTADKKAATADAVQTDIKTKHTNVITDVKVQNSKAFTTGSIDGRVIHWKL